VLHRTNVEEHLICICIYMAFLYCPPSLDHHSRILYVSNAVYLHMALYSSQMAVAKYLGTSRSLLFCRPPRGENSVHGVLDCDFSIIDL